MSGTDCRERRNAVRLTHEPARLRIAPSSESSRWRFPPIFRCRLSFVFDLDYRRFDYGITQWICLGRLSAVGHQPSFRCYLYAFGLNRRHCRQPNRAGGPDRRILLASRAFLCSPNSVISQILCGCFFGASWDFWRYFSSPARRMRRFPLLLKAALYMSRMDVPVVTAERDLEMGR